MAEPGLNVWGDNAEQDASSLTLSKTDMQEVGLTPSATNTAESMVVAQTLVWANTFTEAAQEANPNQQITVIKSDFPQFIFRNNQNYRRETFTINLDIVDTAPPIDPNNY